MKSFLAISLALVLSVLIVRAAQPTQPRGAAALTIEQLIDIRHPSNPVWSPDGRTVAFLSERAGIATFLSPTPRRCQAQDRARPALVR